MARVILCLALFGLAGCSEMFADQMPHWRQPGPAALGPLERHRVPDDGFRDHLAAVPKPGVRAG